MEKPAATDVSTPYAATGLARLVAARAALTPDHPALILAAPSRLGASESNPPQHLAHRGGTSPHAPRTLLRQWTFRQLADQAQVLAVALNETLNLTPGQDTLALAGQADELALGAYAASARGLALWPQDPAVEGDHWRPRQALAGPRARFCRGLPTLSPPAAPRQSDGPKAGPQAIAPTAPALPASRLPQGPALIISTSGSEGEPKAVMLSSANLLAAATASNAVLPLGPGDVWLCCLPLFHIGGQSILWRCALAGATVLLHDGFTAPAVADALARDGVTHLSLVPAMLARLLDLGLPPPASLRHVLIGGAALSAALYQRASAAGWPLRPSYGMSESAAQIATYCPGPDTPPWREGLAGQPLPGNRISVATDGRLRLAGPQIMLGYLQPDGRPGHGLDPAGFLTSDLGHLQEDGTLAVLGRADDLLISGGKNIHPLEIESRLAACPGLADLGITGLPDPVWGQRIVALVAGDASPAQVEAWARQHLPGSHRPRAFYKVPALPRNAMGKLSRPALLALAREAANHGTATP